MERTNFRYDSRYLSKNKERMQEVIEFILDKSYGETISFETIGRMLDYNIENEQEKRKFRSAMARVKNFLVDYGYILKSINGVGYYILKPKQISGYCYHTYIRRTQNLLEKSNRILTNMDKNELTPDRRKEQIEVKQLNDDIYESIGTIITNSQYEKDKEYYNILND